MSMDLKTALWTKGKYIEYIDEVSALEPYLTKPPKPSDPYAIQCLYPSEEEIKEKARCYYSENIENFTYTMVWEYKPSSTEPLLRARFDIPFDDFDCNLINYKNELFDVLVYKVQQYYKDKKKVEEKKMSSTMNDLYKICNDITVDMGINEETMVNLTIPYHNLPRLKDITLKNSKKVDKPWIEGLPAIKKVETYNNRVVKVTFIDDTFTKAICSENDHFDLDVGITICAMKRIFGEHGTREYNRFIEHAHDVMARNEKKKEEEKAAKEAEKAKRRKAELKKAAKELKAKEEYINMHKEAYLRAMKEHEEDDLK